MIDEDVLRDLLAEAAASAPAPGAVPDALVEAVASAGEQEQQGGGRPRRLLAAAAVVTVLAVASGMAFVAADRPSARTQAQVAAEPVPGGAGDGSVPATTIAPSGAELDNQSRPAEQYAAPTAAGTGGASAVPAPPTPVPAAQAPPVPADTAKVIKTGSLGLEVGKGTFERSVERITSLAVGLGGYVAESTTTEADGVPHGSVVVRVPAGSFEQLLTDLRGLGEVQAVTSKGTDVTAQFTDLEARLSALTATRERLLEVLRGARNVGDIIAVQDRITGVQTEIEQVQGQQRLLTDQASLGTLSVTLSEPGAEEARFTADPDDDGGLGGAWREAERRFGDAVEGLVAWSGTAAVVGLVGLVVLVLGWLAWTRGRRRFLV